MRRLLPLLWLLIALPLYAAPDVAALKRYATKALVQCPDPVLTMQDMHVDGPRNFLIYVVTLKSSDPNCGRQQYLLYSPVTDQVIVGTVFPLPEVNRPVEERLAQHAEKMLNVKMTASVGKFPLPDGLKTVSLTRQTPYGPFSYHGYVDASERYLIVGNRGNLRTDPGKTLLDALEVQKGVHRGNPKSKLEIVELSDFECPSCGKAHKKVEPVIEKNLNKVNYTRLDLPLFEHHEWSLAAALGAHAIQKVAPKQYMNYVNFVFANQETITPTTIDKVVKDFCADHDIPWAPVEKIYKSKEERNAILEQVGRAFDQGIVSTPTYIVNGQQIGFGPEGDYTLKVIKDAIAKEK